MQAAPRPIHDQETTHPERTPQVKPIQVHVDLANQTETAIVTHVRDLLANNQAQILADIAQQIEEGPKDAEAEVVLKFSVPIRATTKTLTLNAALEWELKKKRKDETDDQQLGGDQMKLQGVEP